MNILHVKSIKLLTSCVSVVVSGDFCRFKRALSSLLFLLGHTTRDAFINQSLAFSRDVSLGRLWLHKGE